MYRWWNIFWMIKDGFHQISTESAVSSQQSAASSQQQLDQRWWMSSARMKTSNVNNCVFVWALSGRRSSGNTHLSRVSKLGGHRAEQQQIQTLVSRHVSHVWWFSEWRVWYRDIILNYLIRLLIDPYKFALLWGEAQLCLPYVCSAAFYKEREGSLFEYCILHSEHRQTPLTCLQVIQTLCCSSWWWWWWWDGGADDSYRDHQLVETQCVHLDHYNTGTSSGSL